MPTFRHNVANFISVPLSFVRLTLIKIFHPKNIFYKPIERLSPNVVLDLDRHSKIILGKRVSAHSGCRICTVSGGILKIGDNTSFNVGCILTCRYKIEIGSSVAIGPNTMMFDHNHTMGKNGTRNSPFANVEITIGDNTWIGAGVIILAGTHIGANCVIAAGSVVKGEVPDNTVLIQKRESTYKNVEFH